MPVPGSAAMVLFFDIVDEAIAEHDDWHTHEHLAERLSISGFRRGSRWVATSGGPRYFVLYEVDGLETLASPAYLERLDRPTPWTAKMMPHYRGMRRGLCSVVGRSGIGLGRAALVVRFDAPSDAAPALGAWLRDSVLPALRQRSGLGSAQVLEGAIAAPMTTEQRIRGADAGVGWVLLVTGYGDSALAEVAHGDLAETRWRSHGAVGLASATYRMDCVVTDRDVVA
jgi:hypothetical protein